MKNTPKKRTISPEDALQLLEEAKKQYRRYVETSGIYDITRLAKSKKGKKRKPTVTTYTTIYTLPRT